MNNFVDYSKSPAPPKKSSAREPGAPRQAFVRYDRTPAPGLNTAAVALPLRPGRVRAGSSFTEKEELIKLHDLGRHISQQVSDALRVSDAEGRKTLHWYTGALRGAGALDKGAIEQLGKLASRFETIANPKDMLRDQIEPFLTGLTTTARSEGK